MKSRFCAWAILVAGVGFLALPALGQVGFEQDERLVVQKYKASMAKLKEGKALFLKGKYDQAEKKLLDSLAIFPKQPDAYYLLSQVALNRGDVDAALTAIETAESSFVETRKFYSFYYQEMIVELRDQKNKIEESLRSRESALSELKGKSSGNSTSDAASQMDSQIKQERTILDRIDQKLREPMPDNPPIPAPYHYIHGNILFKLKRHQEASEQYLEAIRLDPHHEFAYNNLAGIFYGMGQYQKALDYLLQAEANGVKVNAAFKKDLEAKLGKQ